MSSKNEAKVTFTAETTEFNASIKKANSQMTLLRSEMKLNETQFKNGGDETTYLEQKQKLLASQLEINKEKQEALNEKLEIAKQYYGEDSIEVQKLQTQLTNAKAAEEGIKAQLEACNTELAENISKQKENQTASEKLTTDIQSQEEELKALKSEYVNVTLEQGNNSDEAKELAQKITDLNGELEENKSRLSAAEQEADELGKEMIEAGEAAEQASAGGFTIFKGILADLAASGIKSCISGLKDLLKSSLETGMNFESATSQLAATMGKTTDQIKELIGYAEEMGSTTAFTATEAAEGLNALAMSGLSATEQMEALPDVLNLASAGVLSLDESASYVTGTVKGFKDEMSNAQMYVDLVAKGSTLANADIAELGDALSSTAATASAYGQEADSVTLSLLKLAEQNVTGSEAATALNRAMADLYTPTDAAKGALDELGVSAYDLETGAARDLNDVMFDLQEAMSGLSDEEKNTTLNTIFTAQGLSAYNKMSATSKEKTEEFKQGLAEASDAMNGQGSAAQQAATQLDNLSGDVTLMQSALDGLKISIFNDVDSPLREVVQGITNDVIPAAGDMIEGIKEGIAWAKENKEVVQGVAIVLGSLTAGITAYNTVTGIKTVMEKANTTSLLKAAAAQLGLNTAMLASPITWVVAGITAIVAAGVLLYKNWDTLKSGAKDLCDGIKGKFSELSDGVKRIVEGIKGFFNFTFNVPKIKLPHFGITPQGWKLSDLLEGTIPKLGIEWYAKGAVLTKPTIFGLNGYNAMIGGEAGKEAIAPIDVLQDYVRSAVAEESYMQMIDYEKLGRAVASAIAANPQSIVLNNRELGRAVREVM